MSSWVGIVIFVVALVAAVMLHEWGHFATARKFGMRAERFFFGFGPTLWSMRRGETEYGVKLLPFGGFVRIKGMSYADTRQPPVAEAVFSSEVGAVTDATWRRVEEELRSRGVPAATAADIVGRARANTSTHASRAEAAAAFDRAVAWVLPDDGGLRSLRHRVLRGDEGRFFHDRPGWQRAIVLAAGSGVHFVIAAVLLFAALWAFGFPAPAQPTTTVEFVVDGSPAAAAGLRPGDRVVAVAGEPIDDFREAREVIDDRAGQPTEIVVVRDGERVSLVGTPTRGEDGRGMFGFAPAIEQPFVELGALGALKETFAGPVSVTAQVTMTFEALGKVFGPEGIGEIFSQVAGEQPRDLQGGVSVVGAAGFAGQVASTDGGMFYVLLLIAGVNVFVGVFNLLPLPPLDGGHLAVLAVEESVNATRRFSGKQADFRVDPRTITAIAVPVLVLIGTVFFGLLWLDIANPIEIP